VTKVDFVVTLYEIRRLANVDLRRIFFFQFNLDEPFQEIREQRRPVTINRYGSAESEALNLSESSSVDVPRASAGSTKPVSNMLQIAHAKIPSGNWSEVGKQ
jgi:hypothetical protein